MVGMKGCWIFAIKSRIVDVFLRGPLACRVGSLGSELLLQGQENFVELMLESCNRNSLAMAGRDFGTALCGKAKALRTQ